MVVVLPVTTVPGRLVFHGRCLTCYYRSRSACLPWSLFYLLLPFQVGLSSMVVVLPVTTVPGRLVFHGRCLTYYYRSRSACLPWSLFYRVLLHPEGGNQTIHWVVQDGAPPAVADRTRGYPSGQQRRQRVGRIKAEEPRDYTQHINLRIQLLRCIEGVSKLLKYWGEWWALLRLWWGGGRMGGGMSSVCGIIRMWDIDGNLC